MEDIIDTSAEGAVKAKEYQFTGYALQDTNIKNIEIDEGTLVSKLTSDWVTLKTARADLERIWDESFQAYLLKKIIPDPDLDWQSRLVPPDVFRMVEQGVSLFRNAVMQSGKFYSLFPYIPEIENICPYLETLVSHYIDTSNFYKVLEDTMKYGFITGTMIMRPVWKRKIYSVAGETVTSSTIEYEAIDPYEMLLDGHDRYTFRRRYLPCESVSELMRLGELWTAPIDDFPNMESISEEEIQKHWYDYQRHENFAELIYFYGTFYDGEYYFPNYEIVILNRKHVVKATPINNWIGNSMHVSTKFYETTKSKYGMGLIEVILPLYKELTIIYRMTIDNALLAIGGMIEINTNIIDQSTKEKLDKDGFSPFMLFFKENEGEAISKSDYANFNPNILPVKQMLVNDMERATPAINEITAGAPTSKGRPTAKEIMQKSGQGSQILDSVAKRIENDVLIKVVIYTIIIILEKEPDEKLELIIGKDKMAEINQIGKKQIVAMLLNDVGVKIDTISLMLQRKDSMEKIQALLQVSLNTPIANKINFEYIMKQYALLLGFAPKDIFVQETEDEKKQAKEANQLISKFILESIFTDDEAKLKFLEELSKSMSERVGGIIDLSMFMEILKGTTMKGGEKSGDNNGRDGKGDNGKISGDGNN